MNASTQATPEPPSLDPVYTTRDDIARTHNPATPYERMLLTAAAQAWQRYQQALDLEKRLVAKTDPLDLFSSNLDAFKAITATSPLARAPSAAQWNSSNALSGPALNRPLLHLGFEPPRKIVKTNPSAP